MQVVFETFDAAKAAADKLNRGLKRKFSVYRVFDDEGRRSERFVAALSPKQAKGEAAGHFGLSAERWPRRKKETPSILLESYSKKQKRELLETLLRERLEEESHEEKEGEEDS